MKVPLLLTLTLTACAHSPSLRNAEAEVRAIDERQREMVASGDAAGLAELAHPNLAINAPAGRILLREQFLANMRNGEISAERFERTAEAVRITGHLAVVLGKETFLPSATSELGRLYGAVPLMRRYTNVYVFEGGRWFWVARHASVLTPPR